MSTRLLVSIGNPARKMRYGKRLKMTEDETPKTFENDIR